MSENTMSKNNALIIKDYTELDVDHLYDYDDWDIIELNVTTDANKLADWYSSIRSTYAENIFAFDTQQEKLNVERSKELVETGKCGVYCGPIDGITLAWPIERYEAMPPPTQCNSERYPEVNVDTFINDTKILEKYNFDYFKTLVEALGEKAVRQAIVVHHHPGMRILQHVDSKDPLKLHIPVISHKDAVFCFGDNAERNWHMEPGKIYVLNTGTMHGTYNPLMDKDRVHILTRVKREYLHKLLSLNGVI